jgi:hypothetical protein
VTLPWANSQEHRDCQQIITEVGAKEAKTSIALSELSGRHCTPFGAWRIAIPARWLRLFFVWLTAIISLHIYCWAATRSSMLRKPRRRAQRMQKAGEKLASRLTSMVQNRWLHCNSERARPPGVNRAQSAELLRLFVSLSLLPCHPKYGSGRVVGKPEVVQKRGSGRSGGCSSPD